MSALVIQNLKKSYRTPDGETNCVVDIEEFSLAAGSQVALRGQSGTGKTTFLNLIAGILAADEGRIEIEGSTMTGLSESARDRLRGRSIGYIFQTFNLLQGYSAEENVELAMMFGGGVHPGRARSLLERVGLGDRLGYKPSQLSIGQQQRVAVARALANQPQLVLADEPTGSLDPARSQEALALIREICKESGAALLVVSHDDRVLEQFDEIVDLGEINRARRGASA